MIEVLNNSNGRLMYYDTVYDFMRTGLDKQESLLIRNLLIDIAEYFEYELERTRGSVRFFNYEITDSSEYNDEVSD